MNGHLDVTVGNHPCHTPTLYGDAIDTLRDTNGSTVEWTCECGSLWRGTLEFEKHWPGGGVKYQYGITFRRSTPSSTRWKKAERRRVLDAIKSATV